MLEMTEIGNLDEFGQDFEEEEEEGGGEGMDEETEEFFAPRELTPEEAEARAAPQVFVSPEYEQEGGAPQIPYYQPPVGPYQPTALPLMPGEPVIPGATPTQLVTYAQESQLPAEDKQAIIDMAQGRATPQQTAASARRLMQQGMPRAAQALTRAGMRQGMPQRSAGVPARAMGMKPGAGRGPAPRAAGGRPAGARPAGYDCKKLKCGKGMKKTPSGKDPKGTPLCTCKR